MKNNTKQLFLNTLENMLQDTPFEKIRVTEICKNANASPQTFYNHFKDKYELVAWSFREDYAKAIRIGTPEYSPDKLIVVTKQLMSRKNFYQATYLDNSQNSINEYVYQFNLSMAINSVKQDQKITQLSSEQILSIKYHTYGTMALFEEFLFGKIPVSLEEYAQFQYNTTPDFLKKALNTTLTKN